MMAAYTAISMLPAIGVLFAQRQLVGSLVGAVKG
jgi:hypothetical protein